MTDDRVLHAQETAARARLAAASRDLCAALAPQRLLRRAVRAHPWTTLAIAGTGGALVGRWLSSNPTAVEASTAAPTRPRHNWLRLLTVVTQASQVIGALAAAKAAHAQAPASDAIDA